MVHRLFPMEVQIGAFQCRHVNKYRLKSLFLRLLYRLWMFPLLSHINLCYSTITNTSPDSAAAARAWSALILLGSRRATLRNMALY
jgi:hypothetical protein